VEAAFGQSPMHLGDFLQRQRVGDPQPKVGCCQCAESVSVGADPYSGHTGSAVQADPQTVFTAHLTLFNTSVARR
jgi:hypothetical protein